MKITIEPTIQPSFATQPLRKISVEVIEDDLSLPRVLRELIIPILLAEGYNPTTIAKHIDADTTPTYP